MRGLALILTVGWLAACGKVEAFTDASPRDGAAIDAKFDIDAEPFVCEDQACGPTDSCCPSACNANNDPDCSSTCNNGVVENGEYCDPLASCPTSCQPIGCQLRDLVGSGCTARCENGGQQSACQDGDGCCPGGCNATNDAECAATCDNGVLESGEQCDPLASCPTSCPQLGCDLYTLYNDGTCQAQCVLTGTQGACQGGDGCCPAGCNANTDSDCAPYCGNNVVEAGETCDGNCPTCGVETFSCFGASGDPSTCDVRCHIPVTDCLDGDACCAYLANTGNPPYGDGAKCTLGIDQECAGASGWQYREWYQPITLVANQCTTVRIYGMVAGDSALFTTCTPDGRGDSPSTLDTTIASVVSGSDGTNYFPTASPVNDDTYDPAALPLLAGWKCTNDAGSQYLSTAPLNGGGVILRGNPFRMDVTVCGFNGMAGTARFFIWWNGTSNPNPG